MRVGYFQFAPDRGDRDRNLGRIEAALENAEADLIVLPELAVSGYLFESRSGLAACAEPIPDGPTCRTLTRLCRRRGLAVVVGLAERAGDRLYNSAVLVTPEGDCHTYRKAHLFLDEKDLFSPGDLPFPVFEYRGVKLGLLVCFDHFYPEAARALALKGAQVICHPSNLVLRYAHATTACRCIENRVFWVLANRTGTERAGDKELSFIGESQVVAPGGRVLVRAGAETEELRVVDIDPAEALDKQVTRRNHLLDDRRTDLYFRP
ncbi:MAG: nitrilase-related carbon-nitrogen hydrolase [bacterium]